MNHSQRSGRPAAGSAVPDGTWPAAQVVPPDPVAAATWCEAFQDTVARCPGQVALRAAGGSVSISWAQYAGRVRQIAAGLASLGVARGDTVAMMMTNRPEFHLADTAAFHLGAAAFSVYNTFAPEQIRYVLANAGSRVVVCERQFAARLREVADGTAVEYLVCVDGKPDGALTLAELEARGDRGFGFEAAWRAVPPDAVLTLIYTSGTTGPPKGVELTHAQVLAGLRAFDAVWPARPGDRWVSYLPMAHIAERGFGHYRAMLTGTQLTTLADYGQLPAALRDARPTVFGGVPRVWEKLKAAAEAILAAQPGPAGGEEALSRVRAALGLDQVRAAFCGAAPIAPEILGFLHKLGIPVAEVWGMSECLLGTANPPGAIRIGTVGPPLPGTEVRLAGDGELLLRGPAVMRGYHHDPAGTASAVDPGGWLHTGDLAGIDPDGYVTITGPKKEIIITAAGKNVSPASIEGAVLAGCPLIAHAVAIGDRRPYITALIVLDPDIAAAFAARHRIADLAPAALAAHPAIRAAVAAAVETANARLSRAEQIKRHAILPVFWEPGGEEITPTMKLKRDPITARYAQVIDTLYTRAGQLHALDA
jgi:long-chain acyl-CoA synthetase